MNNVYEEILTEHAEEVWKFVTQCDQIYEDYIKYEKEYSLAEYVKNVRWNEFVKYLKLDISIGA